MAVFMAHSGVPRPVAKSPLFRTLFILENGPFYGPLRRPSLALRGSLSVLWGSRTFTSYPNQRQAERWGNFFWWTIWEAINNYWSTDPEPLDLNRSQSFGQINAERNRWGDVWYTIANYWLTNPEPFHVNRGRFATEPMPSGIMGDFFW